MDCSSDQRWIQKKAEELGIILQNPVKVFTLPQVPDMLRNELGALKNLAEWTKSLDNLSKFSASNIDNYFYNVSKAVLSTSTMTKKNFNRGEQFLEENYLDLGSIFVKENEHLICLKGICAASLKQRDRWVTIAVRKESGDAEFAFCQFPSGKAGTCSHSFAMMKLIAKWVLDQLKEIPEPKACTEKPCQWSIPQSRGRIEKLDTTNLKIMTPKPSKKRKASDTCTPSANTMSPPAQDESTNSVRKKVKGIECTLYDARSKGNRNYNANATEEFLANLKKENPNVQCKICDLQ